MKSLALVPMVLCGLNCCAEEQTPSTTSPFFSAPLQLRALPFEPERKSDALTSDIAREPEPLNTSSHTRLLNFFDESSQKRADESYVISSFTREFDAAVYERLDRAGYFDRPAVDSRTPIDRAIDSVFTPEPIRFRKTTISCSAYTAIKRKNPFCLLNPVFLNVSW